MLARSLQVAKKRITPIGPPALVRHRVPRALGRVVFHRRRNDVCRVPESVQDRCDGRFVRACLSRPRAEHLTATASEAATENIPGRDLTCILLRLHYMQRQ
jgi:hypothetical protein